MTVPRFVALTVNLKDGPCQAYSQDAGTRGSLLLRASSAPSTVGSIASVLI